MGLNVYVKPDIGVLTGGSWIVYNESVALEWR
jgi:hypothetical protein